MYSCRNRVSLSSFLGRIGIPLILWITLTACGGGGSGTETLGGGFATGQVQALEFGPDGQAILNFGELSGDEEFALIFFAANVNEGNFGIQLKSGLSASSNSQMRLLSNPTPYLPEVETQTGDPTSNFHQWLREEEKLIGEVVQDTGSEKFFSADSDASLVIDNPWHSPCANGQGIYVKVLNTLNSNTNFDIICVIEKRVTANVIYYVDEEAQSVLSDPMLDQVIADFESKIPVERELLGQESDVNGDGRFAVCFCSGVNRLGANSGGYITGFFFGGDLFSQKGIPSSNEKEILFISVPDPTGKWGFQVPTDFWLSNIAVSVISHEFQHMISYRSKVLEHEIGAEDAWANEGLSHLMEDISGSHAHPLDHIGKENPSRVSLFLASPENAAFTSGTSLAQRGGAYLFFRYLYEQADLNRYPGAQDGRDLLKQLLDSGRKGVENLEYATGWTFRNLLLDFYATLQLSNTGITQDPRYNFHGVDLFAEQDDNRGTVLEGVQGENLAQVPVKGQVSSPGGIYYSIGGNTLINAGKSLNFVADPGMIPGGAVIRLQ